jgi:photosystem II stability/assembly factor-like uncharacterized protein
MLLASVLETDGYVVGSNNGPSGLHTFTDDRWRHSGWTNVRAFSVDVEPDTGAVLLACGNGLLRSPDAGDSWRVETDWRITEVLDVLPPSRSRPTLLATAFGVRRQDSETSWSHLDRGLASTYVSRLVDVGDGRVLAATETGAALFLPHLERWLHIGPPVAVRSIAVGGPGARDTWFIGAERGGVLTSRDGGTTWHRPESAAGDHDLLRGDSMYAVAINPGHPEHLAAGGLSGHLWFSNNAGESWRIAATPAPGDAIHALAFAPDGSALLCGCGKTGLHTLDPDTGATRSRDLDRSFVSKIVFRNPP